MVSRLLAAGATITGKAVCEDLCFSGGSHTSRSGPVRNPWDPTRSAGGSSSGSAALVAAGAVDLAVGGDQGGSVRIPSAYSGTVGHKPTHGLVPYTGAFPIELTLDHLGPITRTVADAALMLGVLAGADGLDPRQPPDVRGDDYTGALDSSVDGLRVGVVSEGFGIPDLSQPGVDDAVRGAIEQLRSAGCTVADVSVPWHRDAMHVWNVIATEGATAQMIDGNAYGMNYQGLYDPELIAHYGRQWRERAARFSETVKLVVMAGRYAIDAGYGQHYAMARNLAGELRHAYDDALAAHDVLVMPTLPLTATVIPGPDASREEYLARALEMIANTAPFDVTGHPATSVPAGLVDGLPAGSDDRRAALRRRHLPARGPRLRASRRRVPGPASGCHRRRRVVRRNRDEVVRGRRSIPWSARQTSISPRTPSRRPTGMRSPTGGCSATSARGRARCAKKPLDHYLPGTPVLSFGTAGCNLVWALVLSFGIGPDGRFPKDRTRGRRGNRSPARLRAGRRT